MKEKSIPLPDQAKPPQWYEFDTVLDPKVSISAFNVSITLKDGTVEEHDNNGVGFPVQSNIMLQSSRTCRISNATGSYFNLVAAVRCSPMIVFFSFLGGLWLTETQQVHESRKDIAATVVSHVQVPRQGSVVPALGTVKTSMTFVNSTGAYDFFSAVVSLDKDQIYSAYVDVVSGEGDDTEADLFKNMGNIEDC